MSKKLGIDKFARYDAIFSNFIQGNHVLDVGCAEISWWMADICKKRNFQKVVGVDLFKKSALIAAKKNIYHHVLVANAASLPFKSKSFDTVILSQVIEHLPKDDGIRLIQELERVAKQKVLVATPNGFWERGVRAGNPHQVHLSGWKIGEFKELGFSKVVGLEGLALLKKLRLILPPQFSFLLIFFTRLTHPLTYFLPGISVSFLAIKNLD